MRILSYLKGHKIAVLLVVCFLILQAACDLLLPNYTSQIVDVGIQQQGIEHVSCDELSARTYELAAMMLSDEQEAQLDAAYDCLESADDRADNRADNRANDRADDRADKIYQLNEVGLSMRDELDALLSKPLVVIHNESQIANLNLDNLKNAYDSGTQTKAEIAARIENALEEYGGIDESLLSQQAIVAAAAEYESLGYNVSDMQMDYLIRTGALMLALAACGMVLSVCLGFIASRTGAKIGADLRRRLFEKVVSFSDAEVQKFLAASLITRGTNDVQLVQMVSIMMLRMVFSAPILAVGGIIMIAYTNASMGWIVAVAVCVIGVVMAVLMKIALPKFRVMQTLIDKVNLVSRETLTGISVIRAFGRERYEEVRFDDANLSLMKTQLFTNRVMTFMMPTMNLIMNFVSVAIVWFGGISIDAGGLQTGDLIAFISYSMVIIMSFLMIGMLSIMLPRASVAAGRIDEVLETESSIRDLPNEKLRDKELLSLAQSRAGATIEFHDVSFRYDAQAPECVLDEVSFTAEAGKTCAIIGSTGSGKSTLLKLIERFYDVSAGSITIDGIDIRDISQHALRSQLGYVPQTAFLFSGTVQSNISYAHSQGDMPLDEVKRAADIAQASAFIAERAEGFDAPIAQGGTNVSGGQRQRLAIARALASDARTLLFDDSFSALDYKTDAALRRELAAQLAGKTLIIVAQRIATVLHADRIVVLDEGRVVGLGTHEQLMKSCAQYQEIAYSQLSEEELSRGGGAS